MESKGQNAGQMAAGDASAETEPLPGTNAGNWNRSYAKLEAFHRSHGHCQVNRAGAEFQKLASWLRYQCSLARRNLLPPERREKLERLQVSFEQEPPVWDARFAALTEFHARHGHFKVPRETPELLALNIWLNRQSKDHHKGTLSAERRRRLQQLGWKPRRAIRRRPRGGKRKWNSERMFTALESFKKRFGHCRVPDIWATNPRLSNWLTYQCYLGRRQCLDPEMRERLLQAGVVFSETQIQRWERMYGALQDYVNRFGDWRVPTTWQENPTLRSWTRMMWKAGRDGKLAPERCQRLAALGVNFEQDWPVDWTSIVEPFWQKRFEQLQAFHARHGHWYVPYNCPEQYTLAKWLSCQRRAWRNGTLNPERQKRLESLGVTPEQRRGERPPTVPAPTEQLETRAA